MYISIGEELNIFFRSVILGCAVGLTYDLLRIIRRVIKRNSILIGIEDLLFFVVFALLTDIFLYYVNGGILRAYIMVGIMAGICLYEAGPGYLIIHFVEWILRKIHIRH